MFATAEFRMPAFRCSYCCDVARTTWHPVARMYKKRLMRKRRQLLNIDTWRNTLTARDFEYCIYSGLGTSGGVTVSKLD